MQIIECPDGDGRSPDSPEIQARGNLEPFENVSVTTGDATKLPLPPSDLIYVNAGVVAPPLSWLNALRPQGRMVLLEAAPARTAKRCDTSVFRARLRHTYVDLFRECGLQLHALTGVDPAPFKTWLLPHVRQLPRPLALVLLGLVTMVSAPVDMLFGRRAVERSWHAVFVLQRCAGADHGG